jgi:hypothetical protein
MFQGTIPTAAKAGGNYLSSLLVGSEARRHGYQEGIALYSVRTRSGAYVTPVIQPGWKVNAM